MRNIQYNINKMSFKFGYNKVECYKFEKMTLSHLAKKMIFR